MRTYTAHGVTIHAFPDATNGAELDSFAKSDPILGLDVETTAIEDAGVFADDARLRLVQLGNADTAFVFDVSDDWQRQAVTAVLKNEEIKFVSHSGYDYMNVRRFLDVKLGDRFLDTIVLAQLIEPGETRNHGLKHLTSQHLDDGLIEGEKALDAVFKELAPLETMHNADGSVKLKKDGTPSQRHLVGRKLKAWGFTNVPLDNEEYVVYAGLDAVYVRRLWAALGPGVKDFFELAISDLWLHRRSVEWQYQGIRVDVPHTTSFLADVETAIADAEAEMSALTGCKARSPKLSVWLEEHGVAGSQLDRTDTGRLSLDKKALPKLAALYGKDSVVGPVLKAKLAVSANSNKAAILSSILRSKDSNDRVHPEVKTLQAKTGRFSATGVAIQTINKDDSRMRRCFLADEGHVLVGADLNQVEVCIGAAYSRDPALLEIVFSGRSMHDITCDSAFGEGAHTDKKKRGYAKTTNFLCQYGGGAQKLQLSLGEDATLALAQKLVKAYRKAYAVLVSFGRSIEELDPVINDFGRRVPADPGRGFANLNYLIQSSGRDLLAGMIKRLYDDGWGQYFYMAIHDEIILNVPVGLVEEAKAALERAMNTTFRDIPITAEAEEIGKRWGGDFEDDDNAT